MTRDPLRIALVAWPGITGPSVFGLHDVFGAVGQDWQYLHGLPLEPNRLQPYIVAPSREIMPSLSGLAIAPHAVLDDDPPPDVVCVSDLRVGLTDPPGDEFEPIARYLRRAFKAGAIVCSVCSGSLLIAQAGLLDGREATTHWGYASLFRRCYPQVRLLPDRVLVPTGPEQRIITAGGASAWNDLALFLIARLCGGDYALQVSKLFLMPWHPDGQAPYASLMHHVQHADAAVRAAQDWIAGNYVHPSPVAQMIARSGLAERTFKRRFKAATGMSPIDYVQQVRLESAKTALEDTDQPVDAIGHAVGYDDPSSFRRLFRKRLGLSPSQYRRRFQPIRLGRMGA